MKRIAAACLVWVGMAGAQAQDPAGQVLFALGTVERIAADGTAQSLARGSRVFAGDTLRTGAQSHLQLKMVDEALIALRPGAELRLAAYRYAGEGDAREQASLELLKGALRSITGAIGRSHKANYRIGSGLYTIGVRGTDHETALVTDPQGAGLYNHVIEGATFLRTPQARLDLEVGETGFAALEPGAAPVRLERMPQFLLTAFAPAARDSGPPPRVSAATDARRLTDSMRGVRGGGLSLRDKPARAGGRCDGPCGGFPSVVPSVGKAKANKGAR